jgi:hypothetical protein
LWLQTLHKPRKPLAPISVENSFPHSGHCLGGISIMFMLFILQIIAFKPVLRGHYVAAGSLV